MGNFAQLDLSKVPSDVLAALQGIGAVTVPATPPASPPAPAPAPPAPAVAPAPNTPLLQADSGAAPVSTGDKVMSIAALVEKILGSGVAGPQAAAVAGIASAFTGVGELAFQLFNPHTNRTSIHPTLQAAQDAAVADFHTSQPGAMAAPSDHVHQIITPVIKVTTAHAAKAPVPAGSGTTLTPTVVK